MQSTRAEAGSEVTGVLDVLLAGVLAGVAAGVFAFLAAWWLVEPAIDRAIGLEEAGSGTAAAHEHEAAPVSREVQRSIGLAAGMLAVGVAGGLAAGAAGMGAARLGLSRSPWRGAAWAAAGAGFALGLLPAVAYPGNPPGVGDPSTTGERTLVYLAVAGIGLAAVGVATLASRLASDAWRPAAVGVSLLCGVGAAMVVASPEVPAAGFPADLLWEFRAGSLGVQVVLWTGLALLFWGVGETRPMDRGV